jgi:CelD/BcsL family acetyltransferase involved in cellulose biosynthesis
VTPLAETWDEQRTRLRKKLVQDTNRCERRLGEDVGEMRVERLTDPDGVREAVELIAGWHQARHNALGHFSMFERDEVRDFYRRLGERCADDERLHVTRLRAGDRTVAAHLGFSTPERFLYYLPTFDEEFSRYAPGRVLAFALLRESIDAGRGWFDLGIGDEPYKAEFGPEPLRQFTVILPAPTARGRAAVAWFARVRPAVGRRLERVAPLLQRAGLVREMS